MKQEEFKTIINDSRFNFNANTIEQAVSYINTRAIQLLRLNFKLLRIEEFEWGISAFFEKENKIFQSIYILEPFRNNGLYCQNVKYTILTSNECGIEEYLKSKKIDYICVSLTPFYEYEIISEFYKGQKAKRSNVDLMNHIDEGLYILEKINASDIAKKAYCLHPIVQSDIALEQNYNLLNNIDNQVVIALIEYRSVANEYLSKRKINSIDEIRLSPLKDVNDMLVADKIQNKKDFDRYHKGKHERSNELDSYFLNWLEKLNITPDCYFKLIEDL